jgi:hypothetical protein
MPIANGMALPRPALLAVAGAMLSMLSFMVMRSLGTESVGDLGLPGAAQQSVVGGEPSSKPKASKPAPPPQPKVKDVPPAVSTALASGNVVVLLFAEKGAADDEAISQRFGALSQLNGVRTFRAGIDEIGRYSGIVARLGVTQAPAIVIVRPDLRAVPPIEGYVDSQFLLQRVKDQLR